MRRFFLTGVILVTAFAVFAQTDSIIKRPVLKAANTSRSNDHFMIQVGYLTWNGSPDSIKTSGLPRTVNAYFLFDFPFKTNLHWSAAIGAGIATDNMYFDKTYVGIKDSRSTLEFRNLSDTNSFKKYKLATAYLEAPIELRYSSKPDDNKRSVKAAIGVKIGTLLSAHVKGKTLENKGGNTVNDYKMKEYSKQFLNKNRISATARFGYGNFSLFGAYSLTTLFKEGNGPVTRPLTLGITLSGL